MTPCPSPLRQALDLALFGPIGVALSAKDALPGWVDTGRRRLLHQVDVARVVGEHATSHGRKVVGRTLVDFGLLPGPVPPPRPASPRAAAPPDAVSRAASSRPGRAESPVTSTSDVLPVAGTGSNNGHGPTRHPVTPNTDLAIPGYDSLSASQVLPRLAGLAPTELEAVRRYEAAGRGRRTILTRISQLQTGRS